MPLWQAAAGPAEPARSQLEEALAAALAGMTSQSGCAGRTPRPPATAGSAAPHFFLGTPVSNGTEGGARLSGAQAL